MADEAYKLKDIFRSAVQLKASDVHLIANEPPIFRIDGELEIYEGPPIPADEVRDLAMSILQNDQVRRLERLRELDVAYQLNGSHRFRINLRWQQGTVALTGRVIPSIIPKPETIGLNETIYGLTHLLEGLVLVTGPAGSGKSTTLASMIDIINTERSAHIITIEDPIEFAYKHKKAIIEQREVHSDTRSFANGVKFALRQDPDVILVGEMRDAETTQAVLTAAETGHLVFSTLHTRGAEESVERILDLFPPHHQQQVRIQLAAVLRGVISQLLLPAKHGGRVAAREILLMNHAIANLIRENDVKQIPTHMRMHSHEGMQTMDMGIQTLLKEGKITELVAQNRIVRDDGPHRYY